MPNNLKDSQQIGQPRRNGQISRNIPPAETEVALDNWNIPITNNNLNLVYTHPHTHTSQQTKVQAWIASQGNSTKHMKKE